MKKLLNPIRASLSGNDLFCLSIYSAFITLFLIHEFSKFVSFELTDLSKVYYSEGTAFGVDISLRVKWMYRLLAGSAILFFGFLFLLNIAFKKNTGKIFYSDLLLFSISGIVLCFTRVFGIDSTHVLSSLFFLFMIKLILVILRNRGFGISKFLLQPGVLNLSISFSFLILFLLVFLFGTSPLVHKNYSTILFLGTILFLFYYTVAFHQFGSGARKATLVLLPLVGIPYITVLSVESFFYTKLIRGDITDHQQTFFLLVVIFATITSILLYLRRKQLSSSSKLYKRFIVPSLLLCYVVVTAYEPIIENIPDMFEPGNILNSHLRTFKFGQIPVLDFMSSHMLSEQWFGYIYSFIFGFNNDLSSLTYGFLNSIVFIYVLYHLLLRLFKKETFALAFIFLFPFVYETFHFSVLIAVLPLFLIKDLFENPKTIQLFKIMVLCSFLMIWRIDTGVVAIIGTAIFLPLMYIVYPKKISLKIIFKAISFFALFMLAIFSVTSLLRGPEKMFHSMKMFYHYVSGSQSHGHQHIYQPDVHQFYLFHIVFPIIAVAACIYILYLLRTTYNAAIFQDGYLLTASLFIFILYIVHLQRGLVRHGFPEYNDDTIMSMFYIAAALFIASLFRTQFQIQKYGVFYGSTFFLFITLKYFTINAGKIPLENGFTGKRFYNIDKPFEDSLLQKRVIIDRSFAAENYKGIKNFMDTYLKKEQTFIDFSNTSMLYYYCERRIPGYFNQNLENTIDDFLHFELLKELDVKKAPVVIYSSHPRNVNDAMDNIPNVMRHYILAEYIFANYKHLGVINKKNIWVTSELFHAVKDSLAKDPETYKPQNYDYKLIAEYLGYYHTKKDSFGLSTMLTLNSSGLKENDQVYTFEIPANIKRSRHCFLSIEFKPKDHKIDPYPLKVELLGDSTTLLGTFSFERRDKVSNTYLLRLSNHYLWHITDVNSIRITKDVDIVKLKLLNDVRVEHKD